MQGLLRDFRTFLLRGNLVDTAVGIVIGIAFAALVGALVKDLVTPVIAAIRRQARLLGALVHDPREPLPLRRLPECGDRVRLDRSGRVLLRREAGQRADGAAADGAAGRRGGAPVPRVPERDPARG
jgi:Large-conductance mechanosensitive channel, MscL